MNRTASVFVAGHRGMVGSAIVRRLIRRGHDPAAIITRSRTELNLKDAGAVDEFFAAHRPEFVFLAAAKVGGIHANNSYPADFIRDNLQLQTNVLESARQHGVNRLLFLGSSCIYPRMAPQPMTEDSLLTGPLEPTNRPYAIAKIAGIEMCWSYNRQHGTRFLAAMPTNLYGPGDNYHPENSHVIPGLIRRFHDARIAGCPSVTIWGTGKPRREFMFVDDMADACVFLANLPDRTFDSLLGAERNDGTPPIVNVGVGEDISIADLGALVARTVGYCGKIEFDDTRLDGTPRKLMSSERLENLGWKSSVPLEQGLRVAYEDFVARTAESTVRAS